MEKTVKTTSKINYLITILTNTLEMFRECITGASALDWDLRRGERERKFQAEGRAWGKVLRWGGTEFIAGTESLCGSNSEWMKSGMKRAHKGHMKGFNLHPNSNGKQLHISKKENVRIQRQFFCF